jgi:hypothetical protein
MSNKRKHQHVAASEIERLVGTFTPSASHAELVEILKQVQALVTASKTHKVEESKPQTIAASSIRDLDQVVHITGIKYLYTSEAYNWSLPDDPDKASDIPHAFPWLETVLNSFRNSSFWHSHSAEALCRTPIDLILFDRLSLKQDVDGARNLVLKGERTITTACLDKIREITGVADYVMGYSHSSGLEDSANLESTLIIIEAKKETTLSKGRAKVAAYLGTSRIRLTVISFFFDD